MAAERGYGIEVAAAIRFGAVTLLSGIDSNDASFDRPSPSQ
jgi:hypothetical protein